MTIDVKAPRFAALVAAVLIVVTWTPRASAQGAVPTPNNPPTPTSAPHPTMPWSGIQPDYGQVVRYIQVPPQPVTLEMVIAVPEGLPSQTRQQVVEVPGYLVTETTTGFFVPERWTIERLNVGVYQWRKLPPEFRKK